MASGILRVVGALVGGVLVAVGLLFLIDAVNLYRQFGPSPEMARVDVDLSHPCSIRIPYRHHGSHGEVLRLELIPSIEDSPEMALEVLAGLSARLCLKDEFGVISDERRVTGADFRPESEADVRGCELSLHYGGALGTSLLVLDVDTPASALSGKAQQCVIQEGGCRCERQLMPVVFVSGAVALVLGVCVGWGLWRSRKPRTPAAA
jgi:hypothetical protein